MKKLSFSFLATLVTFNTLLAQTSDASNEIIQNSPIGDSVPISNLVSYLSVTPKLMMDPAAIEEGTKAVGEALGMCGRKGIVEGASAEVAGRGNIANAISSGSSSSQVLRLRGGGPKPKDKSTEGLKHTGDTSDEEESDKEGTVSDLKSEDTNLVTSSVNKDLKNKTINKVESKSLKKAVKDVSLLPSSSSSLSPLSAENTTTSSTKKNKQSFALEDFRKAVIDYPDAIRFIIKENKTEKTLLIQPDQALDNNLKKINQENKTIIKELLTALSKLHPPGKVVISLASKLNELKEYPSLSESMIQKILDSFDDECSKIDKVMSEWFKINEQEEYPSLNSLIMKEILEAFDEECYQIDKTIDLFSSGKQNFLNSIKESKLAIEAAKEGQTKINNDDQWWEQRIDQLEIRSANTNYMKRNMERILKIAKSCFENKSVSRQNPKDRIDFELNAFIDKGGFRPAIDAAIAQEELLDQAKKESVDTVEVAKIIATNTDAWEVAISQVQNGYDLITEQQEKEKEEIAKTNDIYKYYVQNKKELLSDFSSKSKSADAYCDSFFKTINTILDNWSTSKKDALDTTRKVFKETFEEALKAKESFEKTDQDNHRCLEDHRNYFFLHEHNRLKFFEDMNNLLNDKINEISSNTSEVEACQKTLQALLDLKAAEKKLAEVTIMEFDENRMPKNQLINKTVYDNFFGQSEEALEAYKQAEAAGNNLRDKLWEVQHEYMNSLRDLLCDSSDEKNIISQLKELKNTMKSRLMEIQKTSVTSQQAWSKANSTALTSKDSKITWANNIFRLAERCTGSFFLAEVTKSEARILSNLWVGFDDHSNKDDEGYDMSYDKLRRIRPLEYKEKAQTHQINLERRPNINEKWPKQGEHKSTFANAHLTINNPDYNESTKNDISLKINSFNVVQQAYLLKEEERKMKANALFNEASSKQQKLCSIRMEMEGEAYHDSPHIFIQKRSKISRLYETFSSVGSIDSIDVVSSFQNRKSLRELQEDAALLEQSLKKEWSQVVATYEEGLNEAGDSEKDWWRHRLNQAKLQSQLGNPAEKEELWKQEELWMKANEESNTNFDKEKGMYQKAYDLISALEKKAGIPEAFETSKLFLKEKIDIANIKSKAIKAMRASIAALKKAREVDPGKEDQTIFLNTSRIWNAAANSLERASEYWTKAIKARESGKVALGAEYERVAEKSEQTFEFMKKTSQFCEEGKISKGNSCYNAGHAIQSSAGIMLKAIEAIECRKLDLAEKYKIEAEKMEGAVGFYKEAFQAFEQGETRRGLSCASIGSCMKGRAETMLKAIECRKLDLAEKYKIEAGKMGSAVGFYKEAFQAFEQGKTAKRSTCGIGACMQESAEMMVKAIEAEESEKLELAEKYEAEAIKLDRALVLYKEGFEADEKGKKSQGDSCLYAGFTIKSSVKTMLKAIEASERGELDLAEQYTLEAEELDGAVELMKQASHAYEEGKTRKGDNRLYAGIATTDRVETMVKAIEANVSGKLELEAKYRAAAEKLTTAVVFYEEASEAYERGKKSQGDSCHHAGCAIQSSAETMLKVIECRKLDLAEKYKIEAEKMGSAVGFYKEAFQAFEQGETGRGLACASIGSCMKGRAETMLKAIECRKLDLAEKYKIEAEKMESAVGFYKEAFQAFEQGKTAKRSTCGIGACMQASAEMMVQAIEAEESEKLELAEKYEAEAIKLDRALVLYKEGFEADEKGKKSQGDSCLHAGFAIQSSAQTMLKAIEVSDNYGALGLAGKYTIEANKMNDAASFYKKASEAIIQENINRYNAGATFTQESAETMLKAIEAEESGRTDLAAKYRSAAEKMDKAVELYKEAVKAYEKGKTEKGNNFFNEGVFTYESAQTMLADIEANEAEAVKREVDAERRKANDLRNRATEIAKIASTSIDTAEKAPPAETSSLWNEAIQKANETQVAWAEAVEALRKSSDKVPDSLKSVWNKYCENGENEEAAWSAGIQWCEAKKIGVKAELAKNKATLESEQESTNASFTSLWNEAIRQAREAETAFDSATEAFQNGQNIVLEQFRGWYIERLNAAEKEKTIWTTKITEWESLRNQALVNIRPNRPNI